MATIALVDDDRNILTSVSIALESEGYRVETYTDGASALEGLSARPPNLAILDIKMPRMDGMELLRRLRQKSDLPVIFLTSKDEEPDEALGLALGADDYITKPFHVPEVAARLRALIRRTAGAATPTLTFGEIEVTPSSGNVTLGGKPVDLTASEFRLLNYFMHRQGRVIPQTELLDHLYSLDEERDPNTIEVYVARLRKKLGRDIIKTLRGLGYRMG